MANALVCGGGGFVGSHMVKRLKREGFWVRAVDLKYPELSETAAGDFILGDLWDPYVCRRSVDQHSDEAYQFSTDMGGARYVFTGLNDADVMYNSGMVNMNVLSACY